MCTEDTGRTIPKIQSDMLICSNIVGDEAIDNMSAPFSLCACPTCKTLLYIRFRFL